MNLLGGSTSVKDYYCSHVPLSRYR